jgi:hypothetical protein
VKRIMKALVERFWRLCFSHLTDDRERNYLSDKQETYEPERLTYIDHMGETITM